MIDGPPGVSARAFLPAGVVRSAFVVPAGSGSVLAVPAVGRIGPVEVRPGIGCFADALNQASEYATESASLRARWPDGGRVATLPSAPADAALANLGPNVPSGGPVIIEARAPRAAAAAASRAYLAVAGAIR